MYYNSLETRKLKLIIILISLFFSLTSFGQLLDGYKYVYVQTITYTNGQEDIWGVSSMFRTLFAEKGFSVLTESSTPPKDLLQDPCLMVSCTINANHIVFGGTTVTIKLLNCKNQVIHESTSTAENAISSLEVSYKRATKKAFSKIYSMSYSFNSSKTPQVELPEVEKTNETEETMKNYLSSNTLDAIEGIYKNYQSDGSSYYKIGIIHKDNVFKGIIIETDSRYWKPGEVKAVFEQSSMKGLYSVKWFMGDKTTYNTFGALESEGLLSIEFKNPTTNEKEQNKFIKMFPSVSGSITINKDNSKASGSGFFLTTDGIIATNAHVLENALKIEVIVSNEIGTFTYKAKVLLTDSKNDVALLQIDDEKFKGLNTIPYAITENSEVGSKVFTIGYPLNDIMGSNFKLTDGIISSKSGISDDVRYYQISVPLQPGNSGGPLFNKEGNVIGITSARLNSEAVGTQVENVNYAIKSSYLLNLYNMLPNAQKLQNSSQVAGKELQEQVKILKNYVCLIRIF